MRKRSWRLSIFIGQPTVGGRPDRHGCPLPAAGLPSCRSVSNVVTCISTERHAPPMTQDQGMTLHKNSEPQAAHAAAQSSMDLAMIGNCAISALVDRTGTVVWCCMPRFDGDPVFCALLAGEGDARDAVMRVEL